MKYFTIFISLLLLALLAYPAKAFADGKPKLIYASGRLSGDLILLQLRWTSSEMSNIKGFRVYLKQQAKSEFGMISDISINNGTLIKNGDTLTVSIGTPKGIYTYGWYEIYVSSVDLYSNERSSNALTFEITDSQRDIIYFTSGIPEKCYEGENIDVNITAESNSKNKILYKTVDVPDGFSIDQSTGRINWIPSKNGYFNITLEAYLENKADVYVRNTWTVNVLKCIVSGSLKISLVDMDENHITGGTCEVYEYWLDSLVQVAEGKIDSSGICIIEELDERDYLLYLNGTVMMEKIFISQWHDNTKYVDYATPITVVCGKRTSIEANVARYPKFIDYQVSGKVKDTDGNSVKNAIVRFYGTSAITSESFISNAMVDSTGNYSINLSSEYEYYAYCFSFDTTIYENDDLLTSEYYKDANNIMEARKIELSDDLKDINFTLERAKSTNNTLYGYVKDSYGNPVSFVNVSAFKIDDDDKNYPCRSVATGKDGAFVFNDLQKGKYVLYTVPIRNDNTTPTYLNAEKKTEFYWDNAQILDINENSEYGPYDIIIEKTGICLGQATIEGYVFDGDGKIKAGHESPLGGTPLNGANVYLIEEGMNSIKYTNTDEDGTFFFANIGSGMYSILVDKVGYAPYIRKYGNIYDGDFITENVYLSEALTSEVKSDICIDATKILVTPNPASDHINVSLTENGNIDQITLYNIHGIKQLKDIIHAGKVAFIDVSALNNGIYYIVVSINEQLINVPVCIFR